MPKVCDHVDLGSVSILRSFLSNISTENQTMNILNLQQTRVFINDTVNWESLLNNYRLQLSKAIEKASPGSELMTCNVEKYLWKIVPLILLILGTIGNCTSFMILTKRRVSSYVYLSALAMADQGVLITGLMRHCIDRILDYRLEDSHHWTCVLTQLIGSSLSYLSAWLIVAVTAERAIVIMFPFSSIRLYSRFRETLVVLLISLACLLASSHFLLSVRLETGQMYRFNLNNGSVQNYSQCQLRNELHSFSKAWYWLDGLLYSYLPFFLILCLNGLIVSHVRKAREHRNILLSRCPQSNYAQIKDCSVRNLSHSVNTQPGSRQTFQLTLMLFSISACFLITTCPIVVMKIVNFTQNRDTLDQRGSALHQLLDSIAELLMYLNHSANFYLYCATGSKFRNELKSLCSDTRATRSRLQNQTTLAKSRVHQPYPVEKDLSNS